MQKKGDRYQEKSFDYFIFCGSTFFRAVAAVGGAVAVVVVRLMRCHSSVARRNLDLRFSKNVVFRQTEQKTNTLEKVRFEVLNVKKQI